MGGRESESRVGFGARSRCTTHKMAEPNDKQPPFQMLATARNFLTDAEMDALLAEHEATVKDALLGAGEKNARVRRSQVAFFGLEERHRWLYERTGPLSYCEKADTPAVRHD